MEKRLIITTTKKEQIEKEISLPYYSTGVNAFYMAISETEGIRVYRREDTAMMWTLQPYEMKEVFENEPCTEQEFNDAYTKAMELLSKNVGLWVTVQPLPTPEEYGLDPNGNQQHRDKNLIIC